MKRSAALMVVAVSLLCAPGAERAHAQDASFGCKVLLCAAAAAPGRSGIPYCVPVMQTLFRQLAKGGGWPSCSEGNASGFGYESYQACPAELTPVKSGSDSGVGVSAAPNGNLCADLSKPQQVCSGGDGGCTTTYLTTARDPRRLPTPDTSTANANQRFYFSLQGY